MIKKSFRDIFCILNTPGYTGGSKKLIAMRRKKQPPLIKYGVGLVITFILSFVLIRRDK